MEPSRFSRDGLLPPSRPLPPNGTPRIKVRDRGFRDITWTLGSSLQLGYVVPTIIACRPSASLVTSVPLPGSAGYRAGLWHSCLATRPSGLSLLYCPGLPPSVSAGGFGMCLPQFFHTNTGHHEKVGTTWPPRHSRKSASRGVPNFGDLSVRSRYGPPGCSLSGLIWTRESCPPGAFTSGLPAIGSPQ